MKKFLILSVVILFISPVSEAQDQYFSVLLNKGGNRINKGGSWRSLVMGDLVNAQDRVVVENNGYVALLHISGGSMELSTPGTYSYQQLEKILAAGQNSLLAKYGKYLVSRLSSEDGKGQSLNVTGAVERGRPGVIHIHLPNATDVYGEQVVVAWDDDKTTRTYLLTVKNMFDEVIMEREVNRPYVTLNFNEPVLEGQTLMILNVRDKNDRNYRSRDYGLKRLTGAETTNIRQDLDAIKTVASDDTAINNLLIASFFEENKLLVDAATYYHRAINLAPGLDDYKNLYGLYLRRNGL